MRHLKSKTIIRYDISHMMQHITYHIKKFPKKQMFFKNYDFVYFMELKFNLLYFGIFWTFTRHLIDPTFDLCDIWHLIEFSIHKENFSFDINTVGNRIFIQVKTWHKKHWHSYNKLKNKNFCRNNFLKIMIFYVPNANLTNATYDICNIFINETFDK